VTASYTHDAGNRLSADTGSVVTGYLWDAEGELVGVGAEEYVYDASGSRLVRTDASGVTVYLPGGQELRIDGLTVSASRYYSFAGQTVAVRTGTGLGGVTSLVSDLHGSVIAAVANTVWTATSVERMFTDPFGAARGAASSIPGDHRFLGAVRDTGTGLTLLGARYYDETVGRLISVDPLLDAGTPAQFNAYVYAGNNSVTWSDPSGLFWNPIADLASAAKGFLDGAASFASTAWNATVSFVDTYKAEIVGAVVGVAVFAGCMAITAGAGSIGCAVAAGAAGAGVTNVMNQAKSGKPFDAGSFLFDVTVGGAFGFVGAAAGPVLGAVVRGIASTGAGAAVVNAVRTGVSAVLSKAKSLRPAPAPAPIRPTAVTGGAKSSSAGSGKSGACSLANSFVAATLVLMADGSAKPIEDIALGDQVWAGDPETGEAGAWTVTALITGQGEKTLVTVTTDDGAVVATDGHPFWNSSTGEWEDADDLDVGDTLLRVDGTTTSVTGTSIQVREATVYNLTVRHLHTYYVLIGGQPTLVHNSSCSNASPPARGSGVGGAGAVRIGQAGEVSVRSAFDIGPKATRIVNGRTRIFDGLNSNAVSEVKNVRQLSFTRQLRDYADYASQHGLRLDIYVRGGTSMSAPLIRADLDLMNPVNIIRYLE